MDPKEIAKILLSIKAVTLSPNEPYIYASGIKSPIYCDNRLIISHTVERKQIVDAFLELIEKNKLECDVVAGTATAGIPHAAWIAMRLDKPMVYIRSKAKEHGKGNQIEGQLQEGQKVLVVEDLISTGGSSLKAVEAVREAGGDVTGCVAIFTYEMEKAQEGFTKTNCPLYTLSNFSTLIAVAHETDYIDEEDQEKVLAWNKDPSGWAEKMGL